MNVLDTGAKILVVDDMKSTRVTIRCYLSQLGFKNCVEAVDGEEALWMLQQQQDIALIISDWQMPSLPGIDLARRLQADARLRRIPFLMITSKGDYQDMARAVMSGVHGYLVKPVTLEALRDELQNVVNAAAAKLGV